MLKTRFQPKSISFKRLLLVDVQLFYKWYRICTVISDSLTVSSRCPGRGNQVSKLFNFYLADSDIVYILCQMTAIALMDVSDQRIVQVIDAYVDK